MEIIEYQGRKFVHLNKLVKSKDVLSTLEKKLKDGESLIIDVRPTFFESENYLKYFVYAYTEGETPRFLTSVDRLLRKDGRTLRYRVD